MVTLVWGGGGGPPPVVGRSNVGLSRGYSVWIPSLVPVRVHNVGTVSADYPRVKLHLHSEDACWIDCVPVDPHEMAQQAGSAGERHLLTATSCTDCPSVCRLRAGDCLRTLGAGGGVGQPRPTPPPTPTSAKFSSGKQ